MASAVKSPPTYRRAALHDVEALIQMRFNLLYESHFAPEGSDRARMEEAFHAYFKEHLPAGDFIGWVAEADGRVVGTGGMVLWHKPPLDDDPSGREAYVMNMYTVAEYRGQGIATRLMDILIEEARAQGIKRIRLHASEAGVRVYQAKGFVFNPSDMILKL